MNNQNDNRIFSYQHFDDDEWDSRLPVTGSSGYEDMIKREKRFIRLVIAGAFVLMIVLFAVAAFFVSRDLDDSYNGIAETPTNVSEKRFYFAEGADEFIHAAISPVPIKMSSASLGEFSDYIDNSEVVYDYSSFYGIDEAMKMLSNTSVPAVTHHSHDIRVDGVGDADAFYERVKKNNAAYIQGGYYFFTEYSDDELYELCSDIIDAVEIISDSYTQTDKDMVYCSLYDYKILVITGIYDYAMVTSDNVLFINKDRMQSESPDDFDRIYKSTLYHEVVHMFQKYCSDGSVSHRYSVGLSHNFDNLDMNSLSCMWLVEASAEMNMSEVLGVPYTTYEENIAYIETMNFVSSLCDDFSVGKTQKLSFLHDEDVLYEQFRMTSASEKEEVLKMLYTLELLLYGSDDFYDKYEKTYGQNPENNEEVKKNLHISFKEDVLLTLTKIFYRNLAEAVCDGDAMLQDVYYLMRLFEADIQSHLDNSTYGLMVAYGDFFSNYTDIQNEFFRLLAVDNAMSENEIRKGFEEYSMNVTDGEVQKSPNCYLSFLPETTTLWYEEFTQKVYRTGYYSIAVCKEKAADCAAEIEKAG